MDKINFVGYSADGSFKRALRSRENPMDLETFYNAVNQTTSIGFCRCCKQENIVFAVMTCGLPIKPYVLSLCVECLRSLPVELDVINVDSNGAPPALIYKIAESEV